MPHAYLMQRFPSSPQPICTEHTVHPSWLSATGHQPRLRGECYTQPRVHHTASMIAGTLGAPESPSTKSSPGLPQGNHNPGLPLALVGTERLLRLGAILPGKQGPCHQSCFKTSALTVASLLGPTNGKEKGRVEMMIFTLGSSPTTLYPEFSGDCSEARSASLITGSKQCNASWKCLQHSGKKIRSSLRGEGGERKTLHRPTDCCTQSWGMLDSAGLLEGVTNPVCVRIPQASSTHICRFWLL